MTRLALPAGFAARPPQPGDLPAVVALVRAYEQQFGTPSTGEPDLREEWAGLDLGRDAVLVEPAAVRGAVPGAVPAAYGRVAVEGEEAFIDGYVHPALAGRGLGRALLRELARRAEGRAPVLRAACLAPDAAAACLFASERFTFARRFAWMEVELGNSPPPAPAPPPGVLLRPMLPGEEREFHAVVHAAFAGSWGYEAVPFAEWLERAQVHQVYDPQLWLVAQEAAGGAGAGGPLLGIARCLPEKAGGGWVRSLAVHPAARGRGIGLALLREAFRVFHERGERVVGLGVDTENATGAFELYRRAGMAVREASDVWERPAATPPDGRPDGHPPATGGRPD